MESPRDSDFDWYFDGFRQFYERSNTTANKVKMTAELRDPETFKFDKKKVKVINIGPDPPHCFKKYIWGRKSKNFY